ncbi:MULTISPECIES: TPM domain-containing protein [unclassified Nitratiruptor]|uniref:TPM domain-containing protein n=1 Tax=unclassified Nitratiruptor TaxID=2624044 RepID=UPI00191509C4|nr:MULTISPECIES: TPM domain-containing protein [unclassified Nitratiruptor]
MGLNHTLLRAFALLLLLNLAAFASRNFVLVNEDILPQKTVKKINEIGNEVFEKSGIKIYLAAVKEMHEKKIKDFEKTLASKLKDPFILLTLSLKDHKVDIINSPSLSNKFNKEEILSPLPWKGTIIPILTSHMKNPDAAVEAALLNGYAEIADQIAKSYGVKLKSSIGNTNREIYYWLRVVFYSILALIFFNFIYRRFIRR